MIRLLDVNMLLALLWSEHVHHSAAREWFDEVGFEGWATTPLTELGFVRLSANPAIVDDILTPTEAVNSLREAKRVGKHEFWPAEQSTTDDDVIPIQLQGHKQVTDSYLIAQARFNRGRVATLDSRLANSPVAPPDLVELVLA